MNTFKQTLRRWIVPIELRRLMALMIPLYIANMMYVGMGVIDTIVAGQAGDSDLAGVALGNSVTNPIVFSLGAVLTIVGPMISRLRGSGQYQHIGLVLNNAKLLAFGLIVVAELALLAGSFIFAGLAGDDPAAAETARRYVWMIMLGAPASILTRTVQGHFEGFSQTRPTLVLSFIALLTNIPLNFLFVFGWGPIPAMGGAGCGLATAIIQWVILLGLYSIMRFSTSHRRYAVQLAALRAPVRPLIGRIFRLGLPMGIATLSEVGFFCVVTLVIAPLGTIPVSAQQVAHNVSAIIFMLPLSLGIAASIRAAYHIGSRNKEAFDGMVRTVLVTMYVLVLFFVIGTIGLRHPILSCYTDNPAIIGLASTLLIYCAAYQFPDATQALMSGLLRGCQDTAVITWVTVFCYWIIGFPLACILIRTDWICPALGAAGAWVSFIVSLTIAAVCLSTRFAHTRRRLFDAPVGSPLRRS